MLVNDNNKPSGIISTQIRVEKPTTCTYYDHDFVPIKTTIKYIDLGWLDEVKYNKPINKDRFLIDPIIFPF